MSDMSLQNYRNIDLSLFLVMEQLWMTRSVSEAAQRLNFAQSTVSMALKRLRSQFDDELFVWNGHVMHPTPRAENLMPEIRKIIFQVRDLLDNAREDLQSAHRHFVLATADYVAELYGPQLIQRAKIEAPHFKFDFVEIKPQLINRSSLPDVDMFILPQNSLQTVGLRTEHLHLDNYVCIAHEKNEKLYDGISAEDFLRLSHVGYTAIPRTVFSHEAALWHKEGLLPNFVLTSASYSTFSRIVAESDAVGVVPGKVANLAVSTLPIKIIEPPLPCEKLDLIMVWRPDQDDDAGHEWLRKNLKAIAGQSQVDQPEMSLSE
ncbi:LysR family transcriptional regulator [Hyphomonas adhaerens MHS-3]|uniref:LysR family transcriptional regulator n=1 Tax=Hyphomonas adhaerens MHS-3 TaxID=1280949 RepID=A0A069E6U0_9PROT|nr:LysR family transcriptional regulator [Hyphomonas adhaerens]KCZ86015.1 LysR family transcriptional regulator [Hyphomonas adhaerens MHS-3]